MRGQFSPLRGQIETCTICAEVQQSQAVQNAGAEYVGNGLCAIPVDFGPGWAKIHNSPYLPNMFGIRMAAAAERHDTPLLLPRKDTKSPAAPANTAGDFAILRRLDNQ